MADKARNLRKLLKKKENTKEEPKEEVPYEEEEVEEEVEEEIEEVEETETIEHVPIKTTKTGVQSDIDPLKFFEQPQKEEPKKEAVDPLQFFDLLNKAKEEKEEEKNQELNENKKERVIRKAATLKNLLSRLNKNKDKPAPLLGSLANQKEDKIIHEIVKEIKEGEDQDPAEVNLPEMDEKKKERLMTRMLTARNGLSKMSFAKALLKRTTADMLQKADNKKGMESLKEVNNMLSNEYILKDNDVQYVNESEVTKPIEKKNIDIAAFMNKEKPKEKRSLADMILGKKKIDKKA